MELDNRNIDNTNRVEPQTATQLSQGGKVVHLLSGRRLTLIASAISALILCSVILVQLFNWFGNQFGGEVDTVQTKFEMQNYLQEKYGLEFICVKEPDAAGYYDPTGSNKTYLVEATFQKRDNEKIEFKVLQEKNRKGTNYYDGYIAVLTENAIVHLVEPYVYGRMGKSTTKTEIDLGNIKVAEKYLGSTVDIEKFSQSENEGGRASINVYIDKIRPEKLAEVSKVKLLLADLKSPKSLAKCF